MKTLVIDDDYSCSSMFQIFLEKYGKCDIASLGNAGIETFENAFGSTEPYDLVVIDIILPDMNGKEVLNAIRLKEDLARISELNRTKIILTTFLDDDENKKLAKSLQKGLETYYVKATAAAGLDQKIKELGL